MPRLDEILVEKGLAPTRSQAKLLIKGGEVFVNDQVIFKPAQNCGPLDQVEVRNDEHYVGRGAYKLKAAIEKFQIDPKDLTIADIGASTGGFSDYLLQHGVKKVYAIDVGTGQLAAQLQEDKRVINLEGTDIRQIKELPDQIDLAVCDLSFISLRLTLPSIAKLSRGPIIALFKPQFEVGPDSVPGDGIIKDRNIIKQSLKDFESWCEENGLEIKRKMPSPIKGKGGNQEYLLYLNQK